MHIYIRIYTYNLIIKQIGESWYHRFCSSKYTCSGADSIATETLSCSDYSICSSEGCQCRQDYVGDGINCLSKCIWYLYLLSK